MLYVEDGEAWVIIAHSQSENLQIDSLMDLKGTDPWLF